MFATALLVAACQVAPTPAPASVAPTLAPGEIETPEPTPTEVAGTSPSLGGLLSLLDATTVALLGDGRILVGGSIGGSAIVAYQDDDGVWKASKLAGPVVASLSAAGEDGAKAVICFSHGPAALCTPFVATSRDYGAAWTTAPGPTIQVQSGEPTTLQLSFADEAHGFAFVPGSVPQQARLFVTDDSGTTWRSVDRVCPGDWALSGAARASGPIGWIACSGMPGAGEQPKAIRRTDDGGSSWRTVAMVDPPSHIQAGSIDISGYILGIAARPDGHLWSWSDRGMLQGSVDGGVTWAPLGLGSPDVATVHSASFIDDDHGVALVEDADANAILLEQTADGGRTWAIVARFPRG